MEARRATASALNPQAASELRDTILQRLELPEKSLIAVYQNFGHEISPEPLAAHLQECGHTLLLPVVIDRKSPLEFRVYQQGDILIEGWRGLREPSRSAQTAIPDYVFVPLLAFDERLYRIGYGGGYYDRTLGALRDQRHITAIGLAFDCQKIEAVPVDDHDARLDHVVTEKHWYS